MPGKKRVRITPAIVRDVKSMKPLYDEGILSIYQIGKMNGISETSARKILHGKRDYLLNEGGNIKIVPDANGFARVMVDNMDALGEASRRITAKTEELACSPDESSEQDDEPQQNPVTSEQMERAIKLLGIIADTIVLAWRGEEDGCDAMLQHVRELSGE